MSEKKNPKIHFYAKVSICDSMFQSPVAWDRPYGVGLFVNISGC